MIRRPTSLTRTDPLFPYPSLFRSRSNMAWSVPMQAVRPEPRSSGSAAAASTTGPSKSTMPGISRAACTARVGDGVRAMSDDRLGGELVDPGGWRLQHPAGIVLDEAADGVGQQEIGRAHG